MQQQEQQQQQDATDDKAEKVIAFISTCTREDVTQEEVMKTYETWADTYDKDMGMQQVDYRGPQLGAVLLLSILGADNVNRRILDIGAGTGMHGLELQKLGFTNVDALDASPQMLQVAKQKGIYKNLITAFLGPMRLPIETDTYDAVTGIGCFIPGHVDASCFEELFRITKPGGHVVVMMNATPLTQSPFQNFEATLQRHHDNGLCKWVERRTIPNYRDCYSGAAYILQVL